MLPGSRRLSKIIRSQIKLKPKADVNTKQQSWDRDAAYAFQVAEGVANPGLALANLGLQLNEAINHDASVSIVIDADVTRFQHGRKGLFNLGKRCSSGQDALGN